MDYDLTTLLGWVRRLSRDEVAVGREVFTSDGSGEIELAATGFIQITSVTVDGVSLNVNTKLSLISRTIIFVTASIPVTGARVVVIYNNAAYTDEQINARTADAAKQVGADLGVPWMVDADNSVITNIPAAEIKTIGTTETLDALAEKLIATQSGINVYTDKANQASDDAIMVRDGTTTIDTSKAATASSRTLERMQEEFKATMKEAMQRRTFGASSNYRWN